MRFLFIFFCLLLTSLQAFAEEDPWYKTAPGCVIDGANPGRTNVYQNVMPVDLTKPLVKRWQILLGNNQHHIICSNNAMITVEGAFDLKTGQKKWSSNIPIDFLYNPYGAGQIYKDKQFVAAYSKKKGSMIYQVNPETGAIIHIDYLKEIPSYHAKNIVLYNDIAYLYDLAGTVVAYDITQHKTLWKYAEKNNQPMGYLAIFNSYLAFNDRDGLNVLEMKTGQLAFQIKKFFGAGITVAHNKICGFGHNIIQCFDKKGKEVLNIDDDTITPFKLVMFSDYLLFNNAMVKYIGPDNPGDYRIFRVNFAHLPNYTLNDFHINGEPFFAINTVLYYYDSQTLTLCNINTENKESASCADTHELITSLLLPTQNGLLATYFQNNKMFVKLLTTQSI